MPDAEIHLDGVTKRFEEGAGRRDRAARPALDRVTLSVARGEIVVVVGPSGCGKSTTLRLVAGLDDPDEGAVAIAGRPMKGVPPQERDVAMVFQGYALYPQMTVRQILEFPLKMRSVPPAERARKVADAAALLRIEALLDRRPGQLSGGERQRVAMGRAIVRSPRVFLFDEPLSNLDASLRGALRLEIGRLVRRLGVTALYVTHDHAEAMTLGDRIAVMRAGRLAQVGTPREVYERPATSFVGAFLGSPRMNLIPGRAEGDAVVAGPFRVRRPGGPLPERLEVGVRPEHLRIERAGEGTRASVDEGAGEGEGEGEGASAGEGEGARASVGVGAGRDVNAGAGATGEVVAVEPLGAETHLVVRVGEHELRAQVRGFDGPRRGEVVRVAVDDGRAHVFSGEGEGERLG